MTRDQLIVGKKYVYSDAIEAEALEVLFIGNDKVFYRYADGGEADGGEHAVCIDDFLAEAQPVKEKKTFYIITYKYGNSFFASEMHKSEYTAQCAIKHFTRNLEYKNVQLHSIEIEVEE